MSYQLLRLAPGSYDLILAGEIVGSVVRGIPNDGNGAYTWHAELLDDPASGKHPPPFSRVEHIFGSLQAVVAWLGNPTITGIRDAQPAQAVSADY